MGFCVSPISVDSGWVAETDGKLLIVMCDEVGEEARPFLGRAIALEEDSGALL